MRTIFVPIMTHRQIFLNHIAQTSPSPLSLEILKAEGVFLYGHDDKKWIDMIAGISVSNLGHCHPAVVHAVQQQASQYMHLMVYGEYIYAPQVQLALSLYEVLPKHLDNFYFTNSGAEAVEGALKLAKRYTGRTEIISCHNAYHGSTAGALSAMGSEEYKSAFRPLVPNHRLIRFNEIADLVRISNRTAAVVIEVVQGEAGIYPASKDYLKKLRKKCSELGVLLILDEIQTGCGRTGKFFAFEHYGVEPDILLLGKGLGGGMPIAAFIANREVMSSLSQNPILGHISTFAGNPVCCAAALAVVDTLKSSNIIQEVEDKGAYLASKLHDLNLGTIRRMGLMLAVDMGNENINFCLIKKCIDNGIITDWFLFNTQSMRICPPLTITYEEIDYFIHKLQELI